MLKIKPSSAFMILVIVSAITLPVMMYQSFNKLTELKEFDRNTVLKDNFIGWIDTCVVTNDSIYISGWAVNPHETAERYKANTYPIIKIGKHLFKVKTTQIYRPDVSKNFSKPGVFDYSGFESKANLRGKKKLLSKEIILVSESKGLLKGGFYECNFT